MNYRKLGNSDLMISEISFGCMSLGNDEAADIQLLRSAFDQGINFFDTADLYQKGTNEIMVGKALKDIRDKVYIATKVGNQWRDNGEGWDWNPGKDYILTAVNNSLKRLQTDYIDLYQLHGGTIDDPIDETIEAFEILKEAGKIRHYGISSIRPNVIREYVKRSDICSVMIQYSLLDRRPEESCLALLEEHNIGVLARGGLARGLLVDKTPVPYLNYTSEEVKRAKKAMTPMSNGRRNETQTALKFILYSSAVSSAVVGIRTQDQLQSAIKTSSLPDLTEEEMLGLQKAIPINLYEQHR
ncbi:aldo/keto reductase [Fulvivirgaceae bacterium BMA10]|uniref:Aldo/keto reductase n=1 Tax=Splendidivirga corallicola TaxID=3051826 RepID=A0ABT8KTT8_9BACT|nr:aldo/keto reductase [Fulvivirgaceae bacterium BMA10]